MDLKLIEQLRRNAPDWAKYAATTVLTYSLLKPEYTYFECLPEITSSANDVGYWRASTGRCKPRSGISYAGTNWKESLVSLYEAEDAQD